MSFRRRQVLALAVLAACVPLALLCVAYAPAILGRESGRGWMIVALSVVAIVSVALYMVWRWAVGDAWRGATQCATALKHLQSNTSRLQAELQVSAKMVDALRKSEELYRSLVNVSPNAVVTVDGNSRITFVSPRARELFRVSPLAAVEGLPMLQFVPEFEHARAQANFERLLRDGTVSDIEYQLVRADGTTFPAAVNSAAMRSSTHGLTGAVIVVRDLTEQKQREAIIRASEERFATIFRSNPVGTVLKRLEDGGIVDVNEAFLHMIGHDRAMTLGQTLHDLGTWSEFEKRDELVTALKVNGRVQNVELTFQHADGHTVYVLGSFELLELAGEKLILSMLTDVTDRKRAELQLRDSEERFRDVVEAMSEVFWVLDLKLGRITYVSPRFEHVWGQPIGDLVTMEERWRQSVHPEDREQAFRTGDRDLVARFEAEYRIVRPDGTIRWIRSRVFPLREGNAVGKRLVGVCSDITEEKALERQLQQAQRLEAVGTLASGIAHDINNILSPMLIIPRLLRPSLGPADREMLDLMESNARRGADIVKQLLAFSRGTEIQRTPLALAPVVRQMIKIMRETFPREIGIRGDSDRPLPMVPADATQVHQVLMNLCVNARDAMPAGGTLTLSTRDLLLTSEDDRPHPDARPGRYVVLTVEDTGKGIPPEIIDRIFDPFFTTKELGRGTGLGLSTVMGIVKGHGGFITVQSTVGVGTRFDVYLPACDALRHDGTGAMEAPDVMGKGELILVVDDEQSVRATWRTLLENHGFQVVLASDGNEAMQVLAKRRDEIRVLLTDLMMPNTGGRALIAEVRTLAPRLPIIAATGLNEPTTRADFLAMGVFDVLQKPCLPQDVMRAVHGALADAPDGR